MSASRMKNLILLILTLCALGLLCIVVPNRLAQTHEQRQMLQELKTLYESYGLSVLLDELPRSPVLYSVELSEDGAQTAAQALLGAKAAPAGESGFESTYESELGTLHITRTGGFSAVMTGGSRVRSSEKAAEKLLRAMDFQYQTLTREQTETGAVQIRTSQTLLGVPVLGSQLALSYTDDCLTAVEGTFYTGGSSITRVSEQEAISAADALAQLLGGSLHVTGAYPAWEYRRESALREKMAAVYEQQTGKAPKIEAIHAGLECGLFSGKLPGLDCVSFGPDLLEIHTPREKMSIPSVQRTWKLLRGVLEALA
mgnify:CR=1 FL=1